MNVTLYGWTFKFHKVVRQQNSGAVEDFILSYSAVYLRIQKWKNYWNRSTFAKVIVKIKVAPFLMAHGVYRSVQFSECKMDSEQEQRNYWDVLNDVCRHLNTCHIPDYLWESIFNRRYGVRCLLPACTVILVDLLLDSLVARPTDP